VDSTINKDERRARNKEIERVARDCPQFAQSYVATNEELASRELELEKLRGNDASAEEESVAKGVQTVLNAFGILALLLSLALVVVLPLIEKIVYFYLGRLSFVEKEGLLTLVQALVLFGVYRAYRLCVNGNSKR